MTILSSSPPTTPGQTRIVPTAVTTDAVHTTPSAHQYRRHAILTRARLIAGATGIEETAEIPSMTALLLVVVWHVHSRQVALARTEEVSTREHQRAEIQELFVHAGSHRLRTSLTV